MAADDELKKEIQKLAEAVEALRKNLDEKAPKKGLDSELALLALMPLFGMTPFFGSSLLFPFGLRLAAARALQLHRAFDRAATISKSLAKVDDEDGLDVKDLVEKFVKGIVGIPEEDRQKLAAKLRDIIWKKSS
jgi:hypothetical protein